MARPSKSRALAVWMNGERVGTWLTHSGKPDEFSYAGDWLHAEGARPISLSLPLRPTPHKGDAVAHYFDNLLPDSKALRERIQHRFDAPSARPFDLLTEIGRDCVGAIQLLPEAERPHVHAIEGIPQNKKQIEELLRKMLETPRGRAGDHEEFRISVAGAQEKTALLRHDGRWMRPRGATPTTHILKLPIGTGGGGIDLTTSVENEWLCSRILHAYGIPVASCWMDQFGGQKALVVERFDRRLSSDGSWIVRLPQEDMCQAHGLPPDRKYEAEQGVGIRRIMDLLLGSSNAEQDRRGFFKTVMLFWMLCAIDGHAKNFSVFVDAGGSYRLTPRYDVLSAFPVLGKSKGKLSPHKVKMAMAVEGTSRHYLWHTIQLRHWEETARRCGIGASFGAIRDELVGTTAAAIAAASAELPKDFPESVSAPIFEGLRLSLRKLTA